MPKTAVITGAGGALAAEVARVFAGARWQLALITRSDESRSLLQEAYPASLVLQADLTLEDESRLALQQAATRFGHIDALLNLAGGFAMSAAAETTSQDLERQLYLNFHTMFNAVQAVLPHMLEQGAGFVLGVAAGPALAGGAKMGPYAAAKAAGAAYLKSIEAELGRSGVLTSVLYPMGAIDSPGNRRSMPKADPSGWLDPRELAESILHLATRSPRGHIRELMVYPPAKR